jgi:hypothetical protein
MEGLEAYNVVEDVEVEMNKVNEDNILHIQCTILYPFNKTQR